MKLLRKIIVCWLVVIVAGCGEREEISPYEKSGGKIKKTNHYVFPLAPVHGDEERLVPVSKDFARGHALETLGTANFRGSSRQKDVRADPKGLGYVSTSIEAVMWGAFFDMTDVYANFSFHILADDYAVMNIYKIPPDVDISQFRDEYETLMQPDIYEGSQVYYDIRKSLGPDLKFETQIVVNSPSGGAGTM